MRALPFAVAAVLFSPAAWAQAEGLPDAAPPAPAAATAVDPETPSAASAAARQARKERFALHRSLGLAADGMLLGATALYVLDDIDRFGAGRDSGSFYLPSMTLAATSELLMVANLLLAFTAPPRLSGSMPTLNVVHQIFMYAGAAANIARFVFGLVLAGATSPQGKEDLVTAWRISSIAAPVLFATGMTFKLF